MVSFPTLSVVLPARNEASVIGRTVPRVVSYLDGLGLDYELIVGDSGSTDGTGRIIRFGPANILQSTAELVGLGLRTLPLPRTFPRRGRPRSVVASWAR